MSPMHKEEFSLDTLDMSEILFQWKVMRALGYKSLFDPDFRRELRNPIRRFLYYRIILAEETADRRFMADMIKNATDRLSFFSDAELYKKVTEEEERQKLSDPIEYNRRIIDAREKFEKDKRAYIPMSENQLSFVKDALRAARKG